MDFPSVTREVEGSSESDFDLSLVIPCFNEESRLPHTLDESLRHLNECAYSWELIVVDDGSEDGTATIGRAAAENPHVRFLELKHHGKAAAVRAGVHAARGKVIVFTDADLSTPVHYVDDAVKLLSTDWDVVIGTREGKGARRLGEPAYRHMMGRLFNYLVQLLAVRGLSDTQCGFKGFRSCVARDLFARALLYRDASTVVRGPLVTGFDVELLFLAHRQNYRLYQLPVTWTHVAGSKVRPGADSLLMVRDILKVRLNDLRRRYDRSPAPEIVSNLGSSES
ncbi:MAG: dolichyl-phosphate beta-glucosyltransferase [Nitrolancea sp.]